MGMVMVSASVSLLSVFLGLELISVSTSFMIMLGGKRNMEAAVKLFVLSSVSIAVFSFALALIFPYNPGLMLNQFIQNINVGGSYLVTLAMLLFAAAMAFETALFPFNFWVPDVYQGSPGNVTALLAGVNKKAAFAAFMLIFFLVFAAQKSMVSMVFMILSIATMLFGNIIALVQDDVKRMLCIFLDSPGGLHNDGHGSGHPVRSGGKPGADIRALVHDNRRLLDSALDGIAQPEDG